MMYKKTTLIGEMLHFGERSANGHIYSKDVMKESIAKFQESIANGTAVGCLDYTHAADYSINLQDISHKVTYLNIDNQGLHVELELLDTPKGRAAKETIEAGLPLYAAISGFGSTDVDGNVTSFDFIKTIDIVRVPPFKNISPLQSRTEYESQI